MRTFIPGREPVDGRTKAEANNLAFAQKQALNLIASAVRANLISSGEGARLGDAVGAASFKAISGVYLDILAVIGMPRPERTEPDPEPEEESKLSAETEIDTSMDHS
ncbi:MAG: hypothetical protein MEQ74_05215 [Paracoccus sp.]|nr:hypothetical protein [Paracoccus sp. (in: a-proteobacteria)]